LKKTHKVLLVLLGVIVLAVTGFKAMQPKEPVYQGRKLSEWMAKVSRNPAIVDPAANEALYVMRNEALPIIERNLLSLEYISKAPAWKKRMWDWQIKHNIGAKHTWWNQYDANLGALRVLGTNAIPVLKRLSLESDYYGECTDMLSKAGGVEELLSLLQTGSKELKRSVIFNLGHIPTIPDQIAAPLYAASQDKDYDISKEAIIALTRLGVRTNLVLPHYQKLLESADWKVRDNAATYAGNWGTNAQSLVPALTHLLGDEKEAVRNSAASTLEYLNQTYGIQTNLVKVGP